MSNTEDQPDPSAVARLGLEWALIIPTAIVRRLGWVLGDALEIVAEHGKITVRRRDPI